MIPPRVTRRGLIASGPIAVSLPAAAAAVDLKTFGAKEGQDVGPALTRALAEAPGMPINLGPGEYRLTSPFVYINRDLPGATRAPGLVLVGAGSQRTFIHCNCPGEAAFEIGQEIPYRFSVGGRLEGFSLVGNSKAPPQDGLRVSGAWNYTLADVWVRGFSGNGLSLPWRHDLRWKLGDFETTAGSKIARRFAKGGFNEEMRIWKLMRIFGPGIPPDTIVDRIIDETTLEMSTPATESGPRTIEVTGNLDAFTSILHIDACAFSHNRGWGIHDGAAQAAILNWQRSEADGNAAGGVYCSGSGWKIDGGSIHGNGGIGLVLERVAGTPLITKVERIEFDSNLGSHVWLKEAVTATFERCRFITHHDPAANRNRPEIGVVIGNTPYKHLVSDVEFKGCQFRATPDSPHRYSAIRFGASGGYRNIQIIDPAWVDKAPQHLLLDNEPAAGANVLVREGGFTRFADRTPRAWAIMERGTAQRIAPGNPVELVFDRAQGDFGSAGATPQAYVSSTATRGSDWLAVATTAGLRPGLPVSDGSGRFVADGRILAVEKNRIRVAAPARTDGDLMLLVGGLSVPYAQLYEIEALACVEGATAGSTVELALTVDGVVRRQTMLAAGPIPRQSLSLRALLPLAAGVRVGLRLSHDGEREIVEVAGATGGNLSIIAAT